MSKQRPSGFVPIRRRGNNINRKRLATLERRALRLTERLSHYGGDSPSWTEAELTALNWAIDVAQQWIAADPLIDYDYWGVRFTDEATADQVIGLLGTEALFRGESVEVVGAKFIEPIDGRQVIRLTLRPRVGGDVGRQIGNRRLPAFIN